MEKVTQLQESQGILQAALRDSISKVPVLISYQTSPIKGSLKQAEVPGDLLSPMGDLGNRLCSSSISTGLNLSSGPLSPPGPVVQVRIDSPAVSVVDSNEEEMDANEGDEGNNEVDGSIPDHYKQLWLFG